MDKIRFRKECESYLMGNASIFDLRALGRKFGVKNPTEYTKKVLLIEQIILVLTGEVAPVVHNGRGAPIKNDYCNPEVVARVEELRVLYLDAEMPISALPKRVIELHSSSGKENFVKDIFRGQLEIFEDGARLLPENCFWDGDTVFVPNEIIQKYDVREGDIITCNAYYKDKYFVVGNILTVNDVVVETYSRDKFDELIACYPYERLRFFEPQNYNQPIHKYIHWFTPLIKGQRGCIFHAPKTGATRLLNNLVETALALNDNLYVFVSLTGQFPETITSFRKIVEEENLVYTSYEDEPEKQVFAADFMLKRAKRYAESGRDVLLIVDSFTALARAYNDCDFSSGKTLVGGLESKTVQYLKKYLASARAFEKGGSLTILGSRSENTGNPADEYLVSEFRMVANFELQLNDALARKGIFPALQEGRSSADNSLSVKLDENGIRKLAVSNTKDEFFS